METKKSTQEIYETLRDMIMDFDIMPGSRLTESQLADYFGVSRTPVRAVLQRLESEGQLTVKPKQGCFVRSLDMVQISHYYDVRVALENMSIDEVLKCKNKEAIQSLADKWHPDTQLFGTQITEALKLAEENFHIELAMASRNPVLVGYLQDVNANIRAVRRLGWPDAASVADTYEEHYLICRLMLERKSARAKDEMERHIRKSQERANRITLQQIYNERGRVVFE